MADRTTERESKTPNGSLVADELNRPEFEVLVKNLNLGEQDKELFGLISRALHGYGDFRAETPQVRFNKIASVLGMISCRTPEAPKLSATHIEGETGFRLVETFTGFACEDGFVSPELHEERERFTEMFGEDNVMPTFYTDTDDVLQLGLFVRGTFSGETTLTEF